MNLKNRVSALEATSPASQRRWHRIARDHDVPEETAIKQYGPHRIAPGDGIIMRVIF